MLQGYGQDLHSGAGTEWDELTKRVHWPLGAVMTSAYAEPLRALRLHDPVEQRLGYGGFGAAYRVRLRGIDSVLKLTRDPYEVIAAWNLKRKHTKRVVPVYEVWSLPKLQQYDHWASWWVVHRGYLAPLSKADLDLTELIFDLWDDDDLDLSVPRHGEVGRSMRSKWKIVLDQETDLNGQEKARLLLLLDQIAFGIREMGQHGIDWTDIMPDNLLRAPDGGMMIADFGFGRPKKDSDVNPPELTVQLAREYAGG